MTRPRLFHIDHRQLPFHRTPALAAAVTVGLIGALRLIAAFKLHGPFLLPDEYLYSAVGRSVAHGGWPTVRGGAFDFIPVLAPILVAPAWLIHDVGIAYRVAQAEGVIAMTLAAVPTFKLSRRVGLSGRAAAIAAVFAVLVPDLAFGGLLLSEPFAYPLFLVVVVLAVDAIGALSPRREALFLAGCGLLCVTRLQFCYLPFVYLAASAVANRPFARRSFLRAHRVVLAAMGVVGVLVLAAGPATVLGRYSGLRTLSHGALPLVHWSGANLVLLFIAAGWLTIPGATVGLIYQLRSRHRQARAFATFAIIVTAAGIVEAGVFGSGLGQLEERYSFYSVPLLIIGFLTAVERHLLTTRAHAVLAGVLAAVSVLVPLDGEILNGLRDQSPVMIAFALLERHAAWRAALIVGIALLALACAGLLLGRRGAARSVTGLACLLPATVSVACALLLSQATASHSELAWHVDLHRQGSFVAFASETQSHDLMTALFWNPRIAHVLVIGGASPDGFPSSALRITSGGRFVGSHGRISGPLVFESSADAVQAEGSPISGKGQVAVIEDARPARVMRIVSGWSERTHTFAPNGQIIVPADPRASPASRFIRLRLRNRYSESSTLRFRCTGGSIRTVRVGGSPLTLTLPVQEAGPTLCRFALLSGAFHQRDGRLETLEARVSVIDRRQVRRHA